jgi:hypothetical protein
MERGGLAAESTSLWHHEVAVVRANNTFRFVSTVTQLSSAPVAADAAFFLTFGPDDDAVFNPGASRACVIITCTYAAGSVTFAAFQGDNPFLALALATPLLQVTVAERWDQGPLLCCGRGVTVVVASGCLYWLQWALSEKGTSLAYALEHTMPDEQTDATATAAEVCGHGDRVLVGYANGSLRLFSKTDPPVTVQLRNCTAPIVSVVRVAARVSLVMAREAEGRVRLFLCHALSAKSVAELVSSSFVFSLARVEPAPAQAAPSPMRPFVCSVAVAAGRALYFLPLSAACALLDAHAVESRARGTTLPLAAVHATVERVMAFDGPVADVFFVCPGVVHITLADSGAHLTKTY